MDRRHFVTTAAQALLATRLTQGRATGSSQSVRWMWSGALTASSIQVKAKLWVASTAVRLVASLSSELKDPIISNYESTTSGSAMIATLVLDNLKPDRQYYYAVEVDGQLDDLRGRFHTAADGAFSFTVCFASCARSNSTSQVFSRIGDVDPLLFIHMGDMHYENIAVNDSAEFHAAYDMVLGTANQSAFYRKVPIAYIWDDHDFGPNNSDKTSPSRTAARLAYQQAVPHHQLVAGSGDVPIYRAFTIGRVRFILTDARSERDTNTIAYTDPNKSMLGATQKAWLKQELLAAQQAHAAIIWVCTVPWMADFPNIDDDKWNGFQSERRELANFIQSNQINKLFYISGDVHMLAADDGRNNLYADGATRGFPIFQAAALDQGGSFLPNNTYSEGQWPREHQFGLLNVIDTGGDTIDVQFIGRNIWFGDRIDLTITSPYSLDIQKLFLPIVKR